MSLVTDFLTKSMHFLFVVTIRPYHMSDLHDPLFICGSVSPADMAAYKTFSRV